MALASTAICSGTVTVGNLIAAATLQRYLFNDGSVMTRCAIRDSRDEYDASYLFRSDLPGAQNGGCQLTFDVDAASYGYWVFSLPTTATSATATYTDPGSAFHGFSAVLQCERI